jgi:general L-amino acid transport system substrate-binding protein
VGRAWDVAAALIGALLGLAAACPAHAGGAVERIRAEGVLHCGAVERVGIAEQPPEGPAAGGVVGIAVDVCRALAVAVLGPGGRVIFSLYDAPHSFDRLRNGADEVGFLTGGEIAEQELGASVVPGPTIAISPVAVMVPEVSPVRRVAELSGQTVCVMIGSAPQRALEAAAGALHLSIARLAFEEDVEMLDAYNVGRCGAVVGEAGYLAGMRQTPGVRGLASRLLPETLAVDSIIAVTGTADGAWAADVAWVFDALLAEDVPAGAWQSTGKDALPARRLPGLRSGWQAEVVAAVGSYAGIVRRNWTDRLGLAAGPNALWPDGLLLPPTVR